MGGFPIALLFVFLAYVSLSIKQIRQGDEALVERLGRYHRKLTPGLNFIFPPLDTIVLKETIREQVLDIEPQEAITKDNIVLQVDAVVYWRIMELQQAYYAVDDLESALRNLVVTSLRSDIGRLELEQTYSSRSELNRTLLQQLDEATANWGVKITRIEVQNIKLPKTVQDSLELERAAESKKRAAIAEAEGKRRASVEEAEGTVQSIRLIADALKQQGDPQAVLNYLVAQKYVESNLRLGESNNSKLIFMNPRDLNEGIAELIEREMYHKGGDAPPGNGAAPPPGNGPKP